MRVQRVIVVPREVVQESREASREDIREKYQESRIIGKVLKDIQCASVPEEEREERLR